MALDAAEAMSTADALFQSAVTELSKDIVAPKYGGVSTKAAKVELNRARATRDETSSVIDTERARYGTAVDAEKNAIDANVHAESDLAKANQERSQQEADMYRGYAELFGITLDPSSEIAQTAARLKSERPIAEEKLRNVQEMQSVGFLDNPLEWLYNQVQLPSKTQDYNREADIINGLQSSLDAGIKTAQDAANFSTKGIPTITTTQAKAQADAIAAKGAKLKADADENLAKTNVTFATTKLSQDLAIANQTREMTALDLSNAQTAYSAQINAIQMSERHADRLLRAGQLLDTIGQSKSLDTLLGNYDKIVGNPTGTTNRYLFNKLSDEQQRNIAAIGAGKMGTDPYNALHNVRLAGGFGPETSPETKVLFQEIGKMTMAASQGADKLIGDGKLPKEQREIKIGELVRAQIQQSQATAYSGGLFHEVEPAKMIAAGIVPADSRLGKTLEPLTKQTGSMTPEIVAKTILLEYKNPSDAGQVLADYYRENMQLVNSSMNIQLAGIKPLMSYVVPINSSPFGFGGTQKFDLTKPEEATKYLLNLKYLEKIKEAKPFSGARF